MTDDEEAKFHAAVEALRVTMVPEYCKAGGMVPDESFTWCDQPGDYTAMDRVNPDLYNVSFRCSQGHTWAIQCTAIEAHAYRLGPLPEAWRLLSPKNVIKDLAPTNVCSVPSWREDNAK